MAAMKFFVIKRSGQWFVTVEGAVSPPHATEAEAVASAIASAKLEERQGTAVEVFLDEPEDGIPLVYRTGKEVSG